MNTLVAPLNESAIKNIECCICLYPFFKAITIFPCSHTVCKTCYLKLVKIECPQCKERIKTFGDNYTIRNIVEDMLTKHPELQRSEEEMKILEDEEMQYEEQQKIIKLRKQETDAIVEENRRIQREKKQEEKRLRTQQMILDRQAMSMLVPSSEDRDDDTSLASVQQAKIKVKYLGLYNRQILVRVGDHITITQTHSKNMSFCEGEKATVVKIAEEKHTKNPVIFFCEMNNAEIKEKVIATNVVCSLYKNMQQKTLVMVRCTGFDVENTPQETQSNLTFFQPTKRQRRNARMDQIELMN